MKDVKSGILRMFLGMRILLVVSGNVGVVENAEPEISSDILIPKERFSENLNALSTLFRNFYQAHPSDGNTEGKYNYGRIQGKPNQLGTRPQDEENFEGSLTEMAFLNDDKSTSKGNGRNNERNYLAMNRKRGVGFRSWGGKRQMVQSDETIEKKSKFGSWGGKRNENLPADDFLVGGYYEASNLPNSEDKEEMTEDKKYSRAGQKYLFIPTESVPRGSLANYRNQVFRNLIFKKHAPKRPQFQSWGGKRMIRDEKNTFTSDSQAQPPEGNFNKIREKRQFSSWGGKRNERYGRENKQYIQNLNDFIDKGISEQDKTEREMRILKNILLTSVSPLQCQRGTQHKQTKEM